MFTTIISITLSVVSACCWLPNLAIVLIYILKMIIPIFSSTFFKNKFPKIGTELLYFCQWRLFILWFIEFVLYQFNISRLFISILKRIHLCSWCPFSFSVLSFFFQRLFWVEIYAHVWFWFGNEYRVAGVCSGSLLGVCLHSAVGIPAVCLRCCEGSVDRKQLFQLAGKTIAELSWGSKWF